MTAPSAHTRVAITSAADVGEARRVASMICQSLGLDATENGRIALVVTEAASNLHKHAAPGELLLRALSDPGAQGLELIAVDRGPGMDVERCMRDGYSTAGSPGSGLGAISRLSTQWEIYSTPSGTVLWARVLRSGARIASPVGLEVGGVSVPVLGETACGDAWAEVRDQSRARVLVADGLGHGPLAAKAATEAVRVFNERTNEPLTALLTTMHPALLPTRGAAVSIAEVALDGSQVGFAGAGNVAGALVNETGSRGMISQNGTVGVEMRRVQQFDYTWPAGNAGLLVMHSDGLNTRWDLHKYPGLLGHRPTTIAAVLYRDFARGRDDTTVVVARKPEANP